MALGHQKVRLLFIGWLRNSQVVTKIEFCTMEGSIISDSSVKTLADSWTKDTTTNELSDSRILRLARALPGNLSVMAWDAGV
jgi:hypothetical protein